MEIFFTSWQYSLYGHNYHQEVHHNANCFFRNHLPEVFTCENSDIFPEPPECCPFHDCSMPVKMKKHGFFSRNYISNGYIIILYLRRYICPVCGRSVSMLPSFCIQHFQYSCPDISNKLYELCNRGIPLKTYAESIRKCFPAIERRHVNCYKKSLTIGMGGEYIYRLKKLM